MVEPFNPPPYPYHRLGALRSAAETLPGGLVDCSVGTPCDPPPETVMRALAASDTARGYPESAGSTEFRSAAARWLERRFGVSVELDGITACIGTKELVASLPQHLALRHPGRDVVLYPAVSYPTYAMGAMLARCRAVPVPPLTPQGDGLDLQRVAPGDIDRALLLWVNSPSNPSGGLTDLDAAAEFGRAHGVPVFSDECYSEFTWEGDPQSILQFQTTGVVAVHSLSKRSNLAGLRVGFIAGDVDLVTYLTEIRRHAGLMVPGPAQAGAIAALEDDDHVREQRERYRDRLQYLADLLGAVGCSVRLPAGGFYLWVAAAPRWSDSWAMTADLAQVGGLLVSPGEFYGDAGAGFVRIAAVQPMDRLELVGRRLKDAGWISG